MQNPCLLSVVSRNHITIPKRDNAATFKTTNYKLQFQTSFSTYRCHSAKSTPPRVVLSSILFLAYLQRLGIIKGSFEARHILTRACHGGDLQRASRVVVCLSPTTRVARERKRQKPGHPFKISSPWRRGPLVIVESLVD